MNVFFTKPIAPTSTIESHQFPPERPTIHFIADPNMYYTIIMYDSTVKYLHWFITNITTRQQGITLIPYVPPTPPSGIHTYHINLYEHSQPIKLAENLQRPNFNLINATKHMDLVQEFKYKVKK